MAVVSDRRVGILSVDRDRDSERVSTEIPSETDRTISTVMGIGMMLGALYVLFITWRKRVVLSRDAMLVCRGVRTTRYPREDVVGARYSDDLHEVGKFPIGFPVVDIMKGEEIKLPFLAHRVTGGGLRRRELYRRH